MKFDFVQASVQSYKFLFNSFDELVRLAWIPFLIKFVFFTAIVVTGLQGEYLRQGLVLLPSYFAEGWFLACAVRLAILGDRYPASLTGDAKHDQAFIAQRHLHIKIAIVTYALIKLVSAALVGLSMQYFSISETEEPTAALEGPYYLAFVMLFIFVIWAFRYAWIYVPAAIGLPFSSYLKIFKGFTGSFLLLGTWMICFAPVFIVLMVVSDVLAALFPTSTLQDGPLIFIILFGIMQVSFELLIAVITSIAVAFGITHFREKV